MKIKSLIFGLGCGFLFVSVFFYFVYGAAKGKNAPAAYELTDADIMQRARELGMVTLVADASRSAQVSALGDDDIIERAEELGMTFASPKPETETESAAPILPPPEAETPPEEASDATREEPEPEPEPEPAPEPEPEPEPEPTPEPEPEPTPEPTPTPTPTPEPAPVVNESQPQPSAGDDEPDDLNSLNRPLTVNPAGTGDNTNASKTVSLTLGQSANDFARALADAGVVTNANDFASYLTRNGAASVLRVGTYEFAPGEDYSAIMSKITK